MNRQKLIPLLMGASLLFIISCKHPYGDFNNNISGSGNSSTPCDPDKIYFQQQVLPILISNCAMSGCHDDASHKEGVILTSYQKVMATAGVRAGNASDSKLYKVIVDMDPGDRMPQPPQNPLTAQQIQIISTWIQQGAQNLICQNMCDSTVYTFSGAIKPLIENKCQGCHSGSNAQGGIDLSTYNLVKARVTDGKLWGSITHSTGFSAMPKNGTKLSDCELAQFRKWIDGGSLNN